MVAPVLIGLALEIAKEFLPGAVKHLTGSERASEVAEAVVDMAQSVTGTDDPRQALPKLRADPNLALQFQQRMAELEVEWDKLYLEDRQSARQMAIEMEKASPTINRIDRKNAMIIGDVLGLVICIAVLIYVPDLPGEVRGIVSTIAGFFGLGLRDAHQFEFGSSRGSIDKNELLAKARL